MSIAGLRFSADRHSSAPLETKSGSYIYHGDAASFHDWQFRTLLRIRLFEQSNVKDPVVEDPEGVEPELEDDEDLPGFPPTEAAAAASPKASASPKSTSSTPTGAKGKKPSTTTTTVDRSALVNKIIEGLRGDAFSIARDMGLERLVQVGGLEALVAAIKTHVFPRAQEEAKELFRAGQKYGGPLARQPSEPMLSYTQRRRRWWTLLQELDPTMQLSDTLRMELMLELSGLSRQETLVVRACATTKNFEGVAAVLVDQYSGIHLRETSKSWMSRSAPVSPQKGKGFGQGKEKPSGRGSYNRAYVSYPEGDDQDWQEYGDDVHPYGGYDAQEEDSFVGMLGSGEPDEAPEVEEEYVYHEDVDEFEATALNCMEGSEDADEKKLGEAIQLQLVAMIAFGKAKGKGNPKGKGKGKGKLVRSQLTLEQRRSKLAELKARSKCMRCGATGHWAGDPGCKFPGSKAPPKPAVKPTANLAYDSESSEDDGVYLGALSPKAPVANMAMRRPSAKPTSRPKNAPETEAVSPDLDVMMRPDLSSKVFTTGQFKGMTFWTVLHRQTGFYKWAKTTGAKNQYALEFVRWVDMYFEIQGDMIFMRRDPNFEVSSGSGERLSAPKVPPNPPLPNKCRECKSFSKRGSTAYTIRMTCLECGHATTSRRDDQAKYTPENCPHTEVDHRGSSRSTHRTFCKLCLTFVDEKPMVVHRERVEIAKKVESAPVDKVNVIEDLVEENPEVFSPDQLDRILPQFAQLVASACEHEAITKPKLHELLHQAIADIAEEDSFSVVGDEGHTDPGVGGYAHVGMCFHGEESVPIPPDCVAIHLEARDMYDENDPNVYVVLDEGCNSTCHSQHWSNMASEKLQKLGYDMPWTDQTPKSFTGLGAGDWATVGSRKIPFALQFVSDQKPLAGIIESHELAQGKAPLLLSLYSQMQLGLVKNMEEGTATIRGTQIPIYRCMKTGLLMLNITSGLIDPTESRDNPKEGTKIPKCHRQFVTRTALTGSAAASLGAMFPRGLGWTFDDVETARRSVQAAMESDTQVLVITRGVEYGTRITVPGSRVYLPVDAKALHDPHQNPRQRGHVGTHNEILKGLLQTEEMRRCAENISDALQRAPHGRAVVDASCRKGRHRSVGASTVVKGIAEGLGLSVEVIHLDSPYWRDMSCGAQCHACRDEVEVRRLVAGALDSWGVSRDFPRIRPEERVVKIKGTAAGRITLKKAARPSSTVPEPPLPPPAEPYPEPGRAPQPLDVRDPLAQEVRDLRREIQELRRQHQCDRSRSPVRRRRRRNSRDSRSPVRSRRRLPTPPRPPSPIRRPREPSHPPVRRPREPDHPPPTTLTRGSDHPPSVTRPQDDRTEIEGLFREALAVGGEFHGTSAEPRALEPTLLSQAVDFCRENGDRDRLMWICNPDLDDDEQKRKGVRLSIKVRSHCRSSKVQIPAECKHWLRTTWYRLREGGGDTWILLEDQVNERDPGGRPSTSWVDMIVVRQPRPDRDSHRAYMVRGGDVRDQFEKSLNPRKMLAVKSKSKPVAKQEPVTDSETLKSPSSPSTPTAYMVNDPDWTTHASVLIDLDSDVEVVHESDLSCHSSSFAGVGQTPGNELLSVHPSERTTMSRKFRKTVVEGVDTLNKHDKTLKQSLGLTVQPNTHLTHVGVVTSHPSLFQDTFDSYDVGANAMHVDDTGDPQVWQSVFGEHEVIVVVISYDGVETPLNHINLLFELEMHADATGCQYLLIDVAHTQRWEEYRTPQVPYINDLGLAFVSNSDGLISSFQDWSQYRAFDEVLSWDFVRWLEEWSTDKALDDQMSVAFPAAVQEELMEDENTFDSTLEAQDLAEENPVEDLIAEDTMLDNVHIPGLPEDEQDRRTKWRALPQRVRIAVRRLHRAFGHVPKNVMINLLRAAKVKKEFIEATRLHRCTTCEQVSQKKPTHKVAMPHDYVFNHTVGIDLLELTDTIGQKYQVLNMICLGTCFQMAEVVKVGPGQASSKTCLDALMRRWISWAGNPVALVCDRGLHNRGVIAKYMDENGIQVYHVPLESPESLGRVERHGGLLKALFRKVCTEVQGSTKEQVESILNQVIMVKNDSSRVGGFSPAQWVLGRAPRATASVMSEDQFAELGSLEARHDPTSIFALQHMARLEAQKAYVHLDCSRRVQRALTKNASAIPRDYQVGDLVTFRRDTQRGGTSWSPTSRVIGFEGSRNVWVLCGNVPVLVAVQNLRVASPSEALAHSVLHGVPIVPAEIVNDSGQQSFLDARRPTDGEDDGGPREEAPRMIQEGNHGPAPIEIPDEELPPIPESDDADLGVDLPQDFWEEGEPDEADGLEDLLREAREDTRRDNETERNVRPRLGENSSSSGYRQPESERGTSLAPSRRESTEAQAWPNVYNNLDDLPEALRNHFQRAREASSSMTPDERAESTALFTAFLSQTGQEDEGKKVLKVIHYETAPPEVQKGLQGSRAKEWSKFEQFGAAIPVVGKEKDDLLAEGHRVIPSKWVDTDKAEFKKGSPDYQPIWKSRLVSCGNFEDSEGLRSDSPTADIDVHLLICIWASCFNLSLHSADVTNAYFQGQPLDRIVLMAQPRGGLPGVNPEALLLIRVPVYGLTDSGRGFWKRLDGDAKQSGFKVSRIYPALYFLPGSDGDCVAVLASHVDDLLYAYLPEGEGAMKTFLSRFDLGSTETDDFRYCGKQFSREPNGTITIDVRDNTRRIKKINIAGGRPSSEKLDKDDMTRLRSVTGSLAWVARQGRPDLGYRVSRLQSSVKDATVATLTEANRVVDLAHNGMDFVKLRFPPNHLIWEELALLTVTDASFANEGGMKSQQGRIHLLTDMTEAKDPTNNVFRVLPVAFSSTTIRRVCRSTLQAETYSLQNGLEAGDKIRGALAELKGQLRGISNWEEDARQCIPHLYMTDCRSLQEHLDQETPNRVTDKRLGIELLSIHDNLWREGSRTWNTMRNGGDKVLWISTATMLSDCLTKSMKPDLLVKVLRECVYRVELARRKPN